jgi:hypothetical protein
MPCHDYAMRAQRATHPPARKTQRAWRGDAVEVFVDMPPLIDTVIITDDYFRLLPMMPCHYARALIISPAIPSRH